MAEKLNCWEFKKCGREPGGSDTEELGVCLAAEEKSYDGVNGGKNGGRYCWALTGTLCGGEVQETFVKKLNDCQKCNFMTKVWLEEGTDFTLIK